MMSTNNIKKLEEELNNKYNLAVKAWGSEKLANYMCQENYYKSEEIDNQEIPKDAILDSSGLYYWINNADGMGQSRWRTNKQLQEMEIRYIEDKKHGMWDKYRDMSRQEWNNAIKLSSDIIQLRYKLSQIKNLYINCSLITLSVN